MAKRKTPAPVHSPLSAFDLELQAYVARHVLVEGFAPSQRAIAEALGKGLSSVQLSIRKLVRAGQLETAANGRAIPAPRTLAEGAIYVPLLGAVAAGRPIEAIERAERIEVPAWMMKPQATYFVLRVRGQSMIEDSIEDGDFVLIRQTESARNGERVVALLDNEATLKRFERRADGRVRLHPANASMTAIEVGAHQELRIAGIFSGVLRRAEA